MLAYDLPADPHHGDWIPILIKLVRHVAAAHRRVQARRFAAPWRPRRPHAPR